MLKDIWKYFNLKIILKEEWRDISGYEGLYQVSHCGRVRSLDRRVKIRSKDVFFKGKILNNIKSKVGYLGVSLRKGGKKKQVKVHRLVARTFIINPENKPYVNHM